MTAQRKHIPCSHLVPHDVRIARNSSIGEHGEVVATVECERRACTLRVEECAVCERFARIEAHEAGYVLLCRSQDSEPPPADVENLEACAVIKES